MLLFAFLLTLFIIEIVLIISLYIDLYFPNFKTLVGLSLGLKGSSYEGYDTHLTIPYLYQHIIKFNQTLFEQFNLLEKQAVNIIEESYRCLAESIKSGNLSLQQARYDNNQPVLLEVRFWQHAMSATLYKNKIYIANKGASITGSGQGIICYEIDEQRVKKNLNRFNNLLNSNFRKNLPIDKLSKEFGLIQIKEIPLRAQKQGNCSYTNIKRGFYAILVALKENESSFKSLDVKKIYHQFSMFDIMHAIDDFLDYIKFDNNDVNIKALDPLIRYLSLKTRSIKPRSIEISKYIIDTLSKNESLTEEKLKEGVLNIEENKENENLMMSRIYYANYSKNQDNVEFDTSQTPHIIEQSNIEKNKVLRKHYRDEGLKKAGLDLTNKNKKK